MRVILNKNDYDAVWDKILLEFKFRPSNENWLSLPLTNKKYHLSEIWTEKQEKLINEIFKRSVMSQMYALDWQHDCFIYDPHEDIALGYCYFDEGRDCNVYFPSYYPDGDFYFFISTDWKYGLFGHPWKSEIYVMGEPLIEEFDKSKDILKLSEI